jgi:hypothetical protein
VTRLLRDQCPGLRLVPVDGGVKALVPTIDGQSFVDLVAAFETSRGCEQSGGYAGIISAHFNFGDLTLYYEARELRHWPSPQHAWLLGCDCWRGWVLAANSTHRGDR